MGQLDRISSPTDVRRLGARPADELAGEIRTFLVESVSRTGGHLGPNLGVVELTIALHRRFRSPQDAIVFDTGHQSYVHKLLTGRQAAFRLLRQYGGLSGYPSRGESPHDLVENSHASTALSYADGLAKGFEVSGRTDRRVIAVVGDGSLTGGMAWEALNNIGAGRRPVIVVLNDNGRSYAPTAGALAGHLTALRDRTSAGCLFEQLGLHYLGPVDGHDLDALAEAFDRAAALDGPVVVHCLTRKGRGYRPAETDEADRLHTVGPAPRPHRVTETSPAEDRPWTDLFGEALAGLAGRRPDVVAVTAAMRLPTGLGPMSDRFGERVYDVGIAEQHAVASAAGLATAGLRPVVAIYSTFLNRAFDQVLMDVALHQLNVTFVLDRAGITGPDGPSHHGMWDVGLLGLVPGLRLAAPRDGRRLRELLDEAVGGDGPRALRFPRGRAPAELAGLGRIGCAERLTPAGAETGRVLLLPVGPLAGAALAAADALGRGGIDADVVDPRWLVADAELVAEAAAHRLVVTVEDNALPGGFGERLTAALRAGRADSEVLTLGLPTDFVPAGGRSELLHRFGLDAAGIERAVRSVL